MRAITEPEKKKKKEKKVSGASSGGFKRRIPYVGI
jgi:hypothetical protein